MKDKKLQVFVSSTYTDLIEERQAAVEAILQSDNIPAGMELFKSGNQTQMEVIKTWIDDSDVYLLILGSRYGSVEPVSGKSYTQLEYEYAVLKGMPLFSVVITKEAIEKKATKGTKFLEMENQQKLKDFRDIVCKNVIEFWEETKDIQLTIFKKLSEYNLRSDLVGWIRGDRGVNSAVLAEEMAKLSKENSELRSQSHSKDNNYGGLAYDELKKMLKKDSIRNGEVDLYNFIMAHGSKIALTVSSRIINESGLIKLASYGILKKFSVPGGDNYEFTDMGRNFYLKSLSLQHETTEYDT